MTPLNTHNRSGATLVELLVVIALITALAALTLGLLPSVTNKDMTLKGTAQVQTTCKVAQALAGSARLPRGVRFLVQPGTSLSTEMELLEAPLVMVADPNVLVASAADPTGVNGPRVEFQYEFYDAATPSIDPIHQPPNPAPNPPVIPPAGTIMRRHCYLIGLNQFQAAQIADGAVLVMPVLNAWSRINSVITPWTSTTAPMEVELDVYPDSALGAAGGKFGAVVPGEVSYRTYHFGIYGPPVPLLGESTIPMPRGIAVDLEVSSPSIRAGQPYYDILFAPSGQTLSTYSSTGVAANATVFLWVRDITNVSSMTPLSRWVFDPAQAQFALGGEQQIVGIRNGFIGTAPVLWPDVNGTYTANQDPYSLARSKLN